MPNQINTAFDSEEIIGLVDRIITGARLQDLPVADLDYLKANLAAQMHRRIGLVLVESMSEEARMMYADLLVDGLTPDPEKLRRFLEEYIPDYQDKIRAGLTEFVSEAVASLSK